MKQKKEELKNLKIQISGYDKATLDQAIEFLLALDEVCRAFATPVSKNVGHLLRRLAVELRPSSRNSSPAKPETPAGTYPLN